MPQAQINLPAHMEAYMWNRVDAKKSAFLCIKVSVNPRPRPRPVFFYLNGGFF